MAIQAAKAVEITAELREIGERFGRDLSCSGELHPCDHLLSFLVEHLGSPPEGSLEVSVKQYFEGGQRDARQVQTLIEDLGLQKKGRVLEFAAGYGRVSRHLRGLDVLASDIHREAVDFMSNRLAIPAIASTVKPEDFEVNERFDFIFVLSLFSHLPDETFARWLKKLHGLLRPNGFMMFTTHGEGSKMVFDPATGYAFFPQSDQADIDLGAYGTTVATPTYVIPKVFKYTNARIFSFKPLVWWNTQDEWVIQRQG